MSNHNIGTEALLMSTHNIGFPEEIRKILCGYSIYPKYLHNLTLSC